LDLSFLVESYQDFGGVAYDVRGMLCILLLGYELGIDSSRTLEDACRHDDRFRFVSGGIKPDDRTIGRFRRRLESHLKPIHKQVVGKLAKKKLASARQVAVDGTKLKAASAFVRVGKEALEQYGMDLPTSDPEAGVVLGKAGFLLGYNLQACVDMESGVVLAARVNTTGSDRGQLAAMLEEAKDVLGEFPGEVVADRGYDSSKCREYGEKNGVEILVGAQDPSQVFWTVVDENTIVCPMGREPTLHRTHISKGEPVVSRTIPAAACAGCPFYKECRTGGNSPILNFPKGMDPVHRLLGIQRARSATGKEAMKRRMATIEPFFGRLKWNRGKSRLRLRGLGGATIEIMLHIIAANLKRLQQAFILLLLGLREQKNTQRHCVHAS